jgi:hypothetical protein
LGSDRHPTFGGVGRQGNTPWAYRQLFVGNGVDRRGIRPGTFGIDGAGLLGGRERGGRGFIHQFLENVIKIVTMSFITADNLSLLNLVNMAIYNDPRHSCLFKLLSFYSPHGFKTFQISVVGTRALCAGVWWLGGGGGGGAGDRAE